MESESSSNESNESNESDIDSDEYVPAIESVYNINSDSESDLDPQVCNYCEEDVAKETGNELIRCNYCFDEICTWCMESHPNPALIANNIRCEVCTQEICSACVEQVQLCSVGCKINVCDYCRRTHDFGKTCVECGLVSSDFICDCEETDRGITKCDQCDKHFCTDCDWDLTVCHCDRIVCKYCLGDNDICRDCARFVDSVCTVKNLMNIQLYGRKCAVPLMNLVMKQMIP